MSILAQMILYFLTREGTKKHLMVKMHFFLWQSIFS